MALSKYKTVSEAVASGNHAEILKAQADSIGAAIDNTDATRDLSSLNLRMIQILQELDAIEPQKKETAVERRKREAAEKKAKKDKE